MKLKLFLTGLILAFATSGVIAFVISESRDIRPVNMVLKKRIVIDRNSNSNPDTSASVEIGIDSATRGAILYHMTDTVKVGARKKLGLMILNRIDTSFWIYNGKKWKKAGT